jgi:hypothetical protein
MITGGSVIGIYVARRVQMTEMPQLVAALHSFVGLAAVFIGFNAHIEVGQVASMDEGAQSALFGFAGILAHKSSVELAIMKVEVFLGVFIGAVTFTGSVVAFGKLAGKVDGKAKKLPGGHFLNTAAAILSLLMLLMYASGAGVWTLVAMTLAAFFIGYHLIMGIGGADMPVVVSMLNSYSGWAAAAIGFTLGNDLLIVTGALVGSSGAILSYIMCKAMNRSFVSVILGGFGATRGPAMEIFGDQVAIDAEGVAAALNDADSIIIVPGYGMAVAQAQQSVSELSRKLRASWQERALCHPPGRRPSAGPHERAAGRGQGAIRHRTGNGRDQRRLPLHGRRHRHRLQRHRQSGRTGRRQFPDRRDAGPRGLEGQAGVRLQTRPGNRLFRHREPAVLQGQHTHVLRRCEEKYRPAVARDRIGGPARRARRTIPSGGSSSACMEFQIGPVRFAPLRFRSEPRAPGRRPLHYRKGSGSRHCRASWSCQLQLLRVPSTDLHMHGTLSFLTHGETRKTKRVRPFTKFVFRRLAAYVWLLAGLSLSAG